MRHTYLGSHFQTSHKHLLDSKLQADSHLLKPTRAIFAPVLAKPPSLPTQVMPTYMCSPLPVRPSSRHWISRITRKPSKNSSDDMQFEDLVPTDLEDELLEEVIIRPQVSEALFQLAPPQPITAIPPPCETPPQTIGYDVFVLKLDELNGKGVLLDDIPGSSQGHENRR